MNKLITGSDFRKKTNKKKKKTIIILYTVFTVLIGLMLVVYIGQSFEINQLNYKMDKLNTRLKGLEEENHEYKLKVAKKSSLSKIELIAREEIHMIDPEETEVVVLNNNATEQNITVDSADNPQVVKFLASLMKSIGTVRAGSPD